MEENYYQKQADLLNSITVFGKPIMNVSAEYLAVRAELLGINYKHNNQIGEIKKTSDKT